MKRLQLLVALAALVVFAHASLAVVRNVPTTAYPTIQDAIDASSTGDVVVVANGTYSTAGFVNLDFKGKGIRVQSSGGAGKCIIDCLNNPNTRGVKFVTSEPSTAMLIGFTIRNGNVANAAGTGYGGGILIDSGKPIIYQCIIEDCVANSGGGVSIRSGGGVAYQCVVRRNDARFTGTSVDAIGGGIEINAPFDVYYSTIEQNTASVVTTGTNVARGGGVAMGAKGSATMRGTEFRSNLASGGSIAGSFGGGLYQAHPVITVTSRFEDCAFIGNQVVGAGGGIASRARALFLRARIEGNAATEFGGGLYTFGTGYNEADRCFIRRNTAKWGGGIYVNTLCSLFVANSLITDNFAWMFGGGAGLAGTNCLSSCTITRNVSLRGGGVFSYWPGARVENSIVWGNLGDEVAAETAWAASMTIRYSNVNQAAGQYSGPVTFLNCVSANPRFANPLGADGLPATNDDDFQLMSGSPCIDSGSNAIILFGAAWDLRGAERRADDPAVSDTGLGGPVVIDMGAYERFGALPWATSTRTVTPATN